MVGVPDKVWFKARLKLLGKSQRGLAQHLGLDAARITEILNNRRRVSYDEAIDIAEFFETDLDQIVARLGKTYTSPSRRKVPVVGYVGAGEVIFAMDDHERGAGLDEIDVLPGEAEERFAVVVRGDSMAPRFKDGEYLGYSRARGLDPERCHGLECVVQTRDGRKLVKIVERGRKKGTFNLISVNASIPPERDVMLEWVAPVVWHRLKF
jgi:phage repressor protein C with HTH and peptisase S24 domain